MITLFSLLFFLISQAHTVQSNCPFIELCVCNNVTNEVVCNGDPNDDNRIPPLAGLTPVTNYYFRNFKEIQRDAFKNVVFLSNENITIHIVNITIIHHEAFSASMIIPSDSNLSISIEQPDGAPGLTIEIHAFNSIAINRLRFFNINDFNGQSIFESHSLAAELYVKELVFEQCNLTGFTIVDTMEQPTIENLHIRNCSSFKNLIDDNLPTFLGTVKIFEISDTGLEHIDGNTFQAWDYIFKEIIIRNNPNLTILPDMVVGPLQSLHKLDLSNNSIIMLDSNYDWSSYYSTKHLILKQQQQLDLFIKSNILKSLPRIKTIDFSQGFINENDENLILDHVPQMFNLASINISYTNFTDDMIIDLLTIISKSANQTIEVSLLDHTLNDTNFCAYYQIFQQAPNLLHFELDETHECNCIIDLFYNEYLDILLNDTLIDPECLLNITRARCDIQAQIGISQCSIGSQKPDNSDSGNIGTVAFIGTMVGLTLVLIVLLALGSSVVYRTRRNRSTTQADMDPFDISWIVSDREPIKNSPSDTMEEPLENSF